MKKIGIYPGNFQPAARSHYEVYKKLKSMVGSDVFIATTDREPIPEAPLNFGDKEQIWVRHGVPASHIIKVSSLPTDDVSRATDWRPNEVLNHFSAKHTVVIIALSEKEAALFSKIKSHDNGKKGMSAGLSTKALNEISDIKTELSRTEDKTDPDVQFFKQNLSHEDSFKEIWMTPDGKPQYYQPYKSNEHNLQPFDVHAYVVVMDDSKIQGKPVSTTNIRNVLGSDRYDDEQKKKFFRWVFGWFDIGLYRLMTFKFRMAHEVIYPEDEPHAKASLGLATKINQPNLPVSTPRPQPGSRIYNPHRKLEEMVIDILLETMNEDYSSTMSQTDQMTTDMATSLDQQKSPAQQRSDAQKQKQDLVQQKKELEAKAKQNKQQRDNYKTVVKNYDEFQKSADREAIDSVNKQLSKPVQPILPIA